jgi:nucleotide-binding universal stress UspA family protein
MATIERILLPVDFDDASKPIAHQAAILARHHGSEMILLHAITPMTYSFGMLEGNYVPANLDDVRAELIRQAKKSLTGFLSTELDGIRVRRVLHHGDPAHLIVCCARDEKADLIMMSTHGYGAFRRFLLGSVTAKVLHDSEIPVWTGAHIAEHPADNFALRHILCAIDLGPHSVTALRWAAQFAADFGARLTVTYITPAAEQYGPGGYPADPAWRETLVSSARDHINRIQQQAGTKAEIVIQSGDVPPVLNRIVVETSADLLVIGRPAGRLRAAGYAIVRASQVPVVSV